MTHVDSEGGADRLVWGSRAGRGGRRRWTREAGGAQRASGRGALRGPGLCSTWEGWEQRRAVS